MLLTKKACYALIVVKYLAANAGDEGSFSTKDLADLYGLPEETLAKILQRLAKAGLLRSRHGAEGGYRLSRDPGQVTVLEVIKAAEEAQSHDGCQTPAIAESDPRGKVRQLLETALAQLTIAGI